MKTQEQVEGIVEVCCHRVVFGVPRRGACDRAVIRRGLFYLFRFTHRRKPRPTQGE